MGHARALITVEDERLQKTLWEKIIKNNLSVRDVERLAKRSTPKNKEKKTQEQEKSVYLIEMEDKLRNVFGTQVRIKSGKRGGRIEIEFYSPEELERLLEIMQH
jgi:ParB family chromosome partitioning protein